METPEEFIKRVYSEWCAANGHEVHSGDATPIYPINQTNLNREIWLDSEAYAELAEVLGFFVMREQFVTKEPPQVDEATHDLTEEDGNILRGMGIDPR